MDGNRAQDVLFTAQVSPLLLGSPAGFLTLTGIRSDIILLAARELEFMSHAMSVTSEWYAHLSAGKVAAMKRLRDEKTWERAMTKDENGGADSDDGQAAEVIHVLRKAVLARKKMH